MQRKKVLFTASAASHILNFHMPYIEYYKKLGYEVHTITSGTVSSQLIDKSFDVVFSKKQFSIKNIGTIMKIAKIINREDYFLINSNATLAGILTRAAVAFSRKDPLFIHTSHGYLFKDNASIKSKIYLWCEKLLSHQTDLLLTMNDEDYNIAQKYKLCNDIEFIHGCGIDAENFPELTNRDIVDIKEFYNLKTNDKVLLCVGEFSKRKNQSMLITAFAEVASQDRNVKLIFAGTGNEMKNGVRLANELDISNQVIFSGYVDKINTLYRISDIVVSSSFSEGLPFNIMEALHCNIPVIASDIKGHADLIQNNVNGLLFDVNNLKQLSAVIKLLVEDNKLYNSIKANSNLPDKYYINNVYDEVIHFHENSMKMR